MDTFQEITSSFSDFDTTMYGILETSKSVESVKVDTEVTSSITLDALLIELNELKEKVKRLSVEKVVEELQVPIEVIRPMVAKKFKLGHPPTEGEIRHAISKTRTMYEAAEYLGVSSMTLRRYCKLYDSQRDISIGGESIVGGEGERLLWKPTRGSKAIKSIIRI